jgi:predicted DNA-binding protein with PD1-like motif
MRAKVINEVPERTFALIFDTGDEIVSTLERFAAENSLTASRFTAIGALQSATLGYFDWQNKAYHRIPFDEQAEVLSLVGDIALEHEQPKVHAHVVLGRRDGTTRGGHLMEGRVRPTLEVVLTDAPSYLQRSFDPASGLALIRFT